MRTRTATDRIKRLSTFLFLASPLVASAQATTTNVISQAPQFGIYSDSMPPNYTPPPGVLVLRANGSWYTLALLSAAQKEQLGSDLTAKVSKYSGCDAFDRIESVVYLSQDIGVTPDVDDLSRAIEMARFMTPFSTYDRNTSPAPYVSPLMDIGPYAAHLADPARDIWIGFAGGSNPNYPNAPGTYNPCWDASGNQVPDLPAAPYPPGLPTDQAQAIFALTGFSFSLDLVSTQPRGLTASGAAVAAVLDAPVVPPSGPTLIIAGTLDIPERGDGATTVDGTIQVIITSHGGHSEYGFNTGNVLSINGSQVGTAFSMQANCSAFAQAGISPLNYTINTGTTGSNPSNPRNWCPGAPVRTTEANPGTPNPSDANPGVPVQAHVFDDVTLNVGSNIVTLDVGPFNTRFGGPYDPDGGDYYPTSIVFLPAAASDDIFINGFELKESRQ